MADTPHTLATPDDAAPAVPPHPARDRQPRHDDGGHRGRGGRVARWLAGLVALLLVGAVAVVLVLTNTDWGREQLRRRVVAALAGTVHGRFQVGRVSGNLLKGLTLHDVAIADSAGAPFFRVDSATTRYGLRSFFSKKIELSGVTLWHPVVVLDRPPGGAWNWARIFPRDTAQQDTSTAPGWGDWLVFRDARLVNGRVTVRTPWAPDSALAGAARDSAVRVALDTASRALVVPVPGGYQRVQEFRQLTAVLPLVRLAHPDYETMRVEADSLRVIAQLFRPPVADVRQARGAVELTGDSVWFRNLSAELPASRATLSGRYDIETGALRLAGRGAPAALADVRFLLPALPAEGTATLGFDVALLDSVQTFRLEDVDMRSAATTLRGDLGLALPDTGGVRLDRTDLTFANLSTQLLEDLIPPLEVPRHGTLTGALAADGTLAALSVDGDVTFDDPRSGRSRILADGELGVSAGGFRAAALEVTLAPLQVALAEVAAPDLPVGGTVTGRATVNGSTATTLRASGVDLTHLDRGARSRVTGDVAVRLPGGRGTGRGGAAYVDADVALRPLALATVGRFAPAAGLRGTAAGPVRARGTLDALLLDAQLRLSDGGALGARGRLDLVGTPGYDLAVTTRLFNANAVTARVPAMSLTGRATAVGQGVDPATMTAAFTAALVGSTVDSVVLDTARARVRVAGGVLTVDTLAVRAMRAAADVVGTFGLARGRTGELSYRVAADSLAAFARYLPRDTGSVAPRPAIAAARLARARADSAARAQATAVALAAGDAPPPRPVVLDSVRPARRDSIAGAAYAAGVVRGNLDRVDVRGRAGAVGLALLGNTVQRARVAYHWQDARSPAGALAVAAVADSVQAAGFALDSVDVRGTWRKPGGSAEVAVFQDVGRSYNARADYAVYPDRREARFGELRLRFDTTVWAATRPGTLRWGQPGLEIDDFELVNGATGRLFVDGRLPTTGPANLRVEVRDFELGDVLGLVQSDVELRGRVGVDATLTGTARDPVIRGTAALAGANFRGTAVPDLGARIDYAGLRLTARAEAMLERRSVLTADATLPVNLALQGVTGPRLPEGAPLAVDARLDSLPLDLATRFTDVVSNLRGAAVGTLAVRGTVKTPRLTGALRVDDAEARVVPLGVTLRRVAAAVRLQGDTVVIDSLAGYSGGRVVLRGGLGIKTPASPSFDLRLAADNARVLDNEIGRINADAQIAMYGPFDRVVASGGARVRGGVLYIPEGDDTQVLSAGDPAVFAVIDTTRLTELDLIPAQSPLLANLRMDLFLGVDRGTWVRSSGGNDANVEIFSDGDLRVRVDRAKQAVVLDGIVSTERGEYSFLGKRFQLKRGAATFVGSQELNPNLQLTGEYEVRQASREPLIIRILIGGQLLAPRISLESDAQPPIPQTDLLSYVAFGSQSGSLPVIGGSSLAGSTAGGGLVGATAAAATQRLTSVVLGVLVDQAETQLGQSLGADVLNITPSGDLAPELARAEIPGFQQVLKGTQIEFGKYFSRQTFVGLQATPLFFQGDPPIPGFRIEYRFARLPGLSLETSYQPRFFLPEPTLAPQNIDPKNALGAFLVRRWRF